MAALLSYPYPSRIPSFEHVRKPMKTEYHADYLMTLSVHLDGKTVRLMGKVLRLEGDTAVVEASDQGQVTIKLNRDSNFSDVYVEIIGRVSGETSMTELTSYNMGDNIDLAMWEAVVQGSHKYSHMFHGEEQSNGGMY